MNTRILELAEQAGLLGPSSRVGKAHEATEKFAELIVKACADAADMAYDARCEHPGDYVGEQLGYGEEHGITAWRIGVTE